MKKIIFVIITLGFCVNARAQWVVDYEFSPPDTKYIRSFELYDTNSAWVLTLFPADSGSVYRKQGSNVSFVRTFYRPGEIISVNGSRAYLSAYYQKLYTTSDSGINWSVIIDSTMGFYPSVVVSPMAPSYVAVVLDDYLQDQTVFLKSTNSGAAWQSRILNLPQDHYHFGVTMTDTQHINVGVNCQSGNCTELRYTYTTDGGINWQDKIFPLVSNNTTIYSPAFDQQNQVGFTFAPGYYFYRYRTTNGGQNWSTPEFFSFGNTEGLSGIKHIDSTQIWLCAKARSIYITRDNGGTWYLMSIALDDSDAVSCLDAKRFNSKYYAYVGTSRGKIYKFIEEIPPIGIQQISSEIPSTFSLSQNYPNPFNPTTKIKFDIPLSGGMRSVFTQLKIYEVTGRQIAVLVNESLSPGQYEVTFDASAYSSGVYFFEMTTSNFRQVRKMVVMK